MPGARSGGTTTSAFAQTSKARNELKGSRLILVAGLVAVIVVLAGCSAAIAWITARTGGMMSDGMMMGGGMIAEPMMIWSLGWGPDATPENTVWTPTTKVH